AALGRRVPGPIHTGRPGRSRQVVFFAHDRERGRVFIYPPSPGVPSHRETSSQCGSRCLPVRPLNAIYFPRSFPARNFDDDFLNDVVIQQGLQGLLETASIPPHPLTSSNPIFPQTCSVLVVFVQVVQDRGPILSDAALSRFL